MSLYNIRMIIVSLYRLILKFHSKYNFINELQTYRFHIALSGAINIYIRIIYTNARRILNRNM